MKGTHALFGFVLFCVPILAVGQFGPPIRVRVKGSPVYLASGDFNGDGNLDLAVIEGPIAPTAMTILLGNGDGTFQTGTVFAIGQFPYGVAAGDVNNDGKLDLLVQHYKFLTVLLGVGDGTFRRSDSYSVSITNQPLLGDVNGDGNLDVLGLNGTADTVQILSGNGDGTFSNPFGVTAGNFPNSLAIADFNRDGKLDLLVTNGVGDTMSVLPGNGDGTFQPSVNYAAGHNPIYPRIGDFNVDGISDVLVANERPGGISVMLGNGDGTFQAPIASSLTSCCGPSGLAIADYNSDGKLDVVSSNARGEVDLLLGSGNGQFTDVSQIDVGTHNKLGPVVSGDFNGDGLADAAIAATANNQVILLINNSQ